jgi:hypothetical protein
MADRLKPGKMRREANDKLAKTLTARPCQSAGQIQRWQTLRAPDRMRYPPPNARLPPFAG